MNVLTPAPEATSQLLATTPKSGGAARQNRGPAKKREEGKGEASIVNVCTSPKDRRGKKVRPRRERVLPIRMFEAEFARLPKNICRSRWARQVLLEAAAGTRTVGPDLRELQQANCTRAWLGALLDELCHADTSWHDRACALEEAATLFAKHPDLLGEGGASC